MSLHTKYRPNSLDQVLGQDKITAQVERAITGNRAKSYVLAGPSGCGKTTIARIMANRFASGQATAANIEEVNAAEFSGADSMRELLNRTLFRAVGASPSKSIILDEAHALSGAAWRVLLKPVEEPPKHVYWLFCTTVPGKIPDTILTRCVRFDLKPVSEDKIFELLDRVNQAENLGRSDAVLEAITEAAGGSPRQALVNLEKCNSCTTAAEVATALRSAAQSKTVADFCQWLLKGANSWPEAMRYVDDMKELEPESIRIAIINYLGTVAKNAKTNESATRILGLMEPFSQSYHYTDKLAPLLTSIGLVLGLDRS